MCTQGLNALYAESDNDEVCTAQVGADGGIGEEDAAANDAMAADSSACSDEDYDTICDTVDQCPGLDDRIDIDDNGVADCADTLLGDSQFTGGLGDDWKMAWTSIADSSAVRWVQEDAGNSEHSGALEVLNELDATAPINAQCARQCVTVQPNTGYLLTLQYFVNDASLGSAAFRYMESEGAYCEAGRGYHPYFDETEGVWSTDTGTFTTSPSTKSVYLNLCAYKSWPPEAGMLKVRFDNVLLRAK